MTDPSNHISAKERMVALDKKLFDAMQTLWKAQDEALQACLDVIEAPKTRGIVPMSTIIASMATDSGPLTPQSSRILVNLMGLLDTLKIATSSLNDKHWAKWASLQTDEQRARFFEELKLETLEAGLAGVKIEPGEL